MGKRLNELKDVTKKFTEKELKKYQDKLEKLSEKLENEGVEVKNIDDVSVQVFNTREDGATLRVYGVINLSSKLKNLDEVNKVLKIAKPYLFKKDGEVFGLDELCDVGDSKIFVTLDFIMKPSDWTLKESKKSFKEFKKSKLNEDDYMEKYRKETEDLVNDLEKEGFEITNYKTLQDKYFVYAVLNFKKELGGKELENVKEIISTYGFYNKDESSDSQIIVDLPNLEDENLEEKSFKQFKSKAINEAELTELKDAIINREEFVDENVVGTSIGEDYIVSVFDKAVLIFTSDNTPFIIGREDLTEEEMDIVEELYSVLEISVDIEDEEGEEDYEEDEEIFVDDNTSDDLEMTEKSLKESSYPKADKELKSVVKDLKDEFEISSSEVEKIDNSRLYAEDYDYLYIGRVTYKNEADKKMLEEYKEWYEDVFGGRFYYNTHDKVIEFELGFGDDKDMSISMEKIMDNLASSVNKKSLGESKKSKVKTLIKESGERVTTFKKGFDFKKYKSKA